MIPACHRPRTRSRYIQDLQRYWFFGRPTIEELRQDLRAVLKKCRPDWDITTPELKAAWNRVNVIAFIPMAARPTAGISGARVEEVDARGCSIRNSHQFQIVRRKDFPFRVLALSVWGRIGAKIYKI